MHDLRAHVAELSATGCETAGEPCQVSHELMHDLRAHVAELSATGCETAGEPCQVSFELYKCPVHARRAHAHHHHRHHHMAPLCALMTFICNVCCCVGILRFLRFCLCGRSYRRRTSPADMSPTTSGAAPLLPGQPVQGRLIVNGVIQNANAVQAMHVVQPAHAAPSAGPAPPAAAMAPPAMVYPGLG